MIKSGTQNSKLKTQNYAVMGGALAMALGLGVVAGLLGLWSLALLAPLFVAVCVVWPAAGVAALVAACALDRLYATVGGANVRPDELAALALAAALILRWAFTPSATRGEDAQGLRVAQIPLLLPMLAYWGANVLATLVSGDPARSLSLDLLTFDLVVLYLGLVAYLSTPQRVVWAVRLWLGIATVEAAIGVLAFALYLSVHAAVPGVQLQPDPPYAPLVYGTLYEGNIFGSYMSAAFLIALALVTEETARHRGLLLLVCVATAVGLLLSDTRSAWGATVIGALLLLALLRMGRGGRRGRLVTRLVIGLVFVVVVLGAGLAVAPASISGVLGGRLQSLVNFASGSGYGRVQLYKVALDEWHAHPLLGLGPGSFTYRLPGDTTPGPAWLPNLTLGVLHDTGVLGVLALLWLFGAFYVTTGRALRRAPPGELRTALIGLIAAVTALLIAFQLTPGFTLGYSWALLALGAAAARAVVSYEL